MDSTLAVQQVSFALWKSTLTSWSDLLYFSGLWYMSKSDVGYEACMFFEADHQTTVPSRDSAPNLIEETGFLKKSAMSTVSF
jgi:hypothetical protein